MKANTTVSVRTGCYVVTVIDQRLGLRTYSVDKAKRCSCGGTAKRPCRHIRAVADYLRQGGRRAPEKDPMLRIRETRQGNPPSGGPAPVTCPICGEPVETQGIGFWRCPRDPSHYWQWRGERAGIDKFLTKPHPAKQGAFYAMSLEEREAFLEEAARRMRTGGYSPRS
jgi:hypothetical protein